MVLINFYQNRFPFSPTRCILSLSITYVRMKLICEHQQFRGHVTYKIPKTDLNTQCYTFDFGCCVFKWMEKMSIPWWMTIIVPPEIKSSIFVHICGGCILLKIISQENDLCKTQLTVKVNRNSKQHGGLVQYNLTLLVGEQDTPTSLTTEAVEPLRLPISVVKVLWKSAGTVVLGWRFSVDME